MDNKMIIAHLYIGVKLFFNELICYFLTELDIDITDILQNSCVSKCSIYMYIIH